MNYVSWLIWQRHYFVLHPLIISPCTARKKVVRGEPAQSAESGSRWKLKDALIEARKCESSHVFSISHKVAT